jgi:hypothetical protein
MSLGKFQFTLKTWIIVGLCVLGVVGLVIAVASNQGTPATNPTPTPTPTQVPDDGKVHITIESNIGIQQIKITNLNTMRSIYKGMIDLPFEFTCDRGDFLRFTVTTQQGYGWNAWWFNTQTFDNSNPMTMVAQYDIYLTPEITILDELNVNGTS